MLNDKIRRCAHIKTNGTQCGAPALRYQECCHFHWRASKDFPKRRVAPKPVPEMVIDLALIDDPDGIHYALMQVIQGMLNGSLRDKLAGRVLYALQIMSANFRQTTFQRMLDDEYQKSNLNAYEIWDKYAKIREDDERTKLHEKRVEELKKLERTCCKCGTEIEGRPAEVQESGVEITACEERQGEAEEKTLTCFPSCREGVIGMQSGTGQSRPARESSVTAQRLRWDADAGSSGRPGYSLSGPGKEPGS